LTNCMTVVYLLSGTPRRTGFPISILETKRNWIHGWDGDLYEMKGRLLGCFVLRVLSQKEKKALHTINIYKNRPSENEK